jgi:hypothetical protein
MPNAAPGTPYSAIFFVTSAASCSNVGSDCVPLVVADDASVSAVSTRATVNSLRMITRAE